MKFNGDESRNIVDNNNIVEQAYIDLASANAPQIIRTLTIKLDSERTIANPFKVSFAYKSLFVVEASDSATEIGMIPFTDQESNDALPLKQNSVLNFDLPIKNAFFINEAQAGKVIKLVFLLNGSFRPGSLFTEVSSSVEGNALVIGAAQAISATPTLLVSQDLNRTVLHIDASVAVLIGSGAASNFFPIGNSKVFKNTAEMWIRTVAGAGVVQVLEEK